MDEHHCGLSGSAKRINRLNLPQRQRGAAALFAAIGLLGMLVAAGFTIDLARIYTAQHDIQKQANLAALNAARAAGGCLAPDDARGRRTVATQVALDTILDLGGSAEWLANDQVNLGRLSVNQAHLRSFVAVPEEEEAEANTFEVQLRRPLPNLLFPTLGKDSVDRFLTARATSTMAPTASYRVGSTLLSVGSGEVAILNALLTSLLGNNPNLDVLSTNGLLSSSVNLLNLSHATGNDDVSGLLHSPAPLPELLAAISGVLTENGKFAAAAAVQQINAVSPDVDVVPGESFPNSDEVVSGVGTTLVNSMDLVQSLVLQLGNPEIQIFPNISAPGVAEVSARIALGHGAALGLGPAVQDNTGRYLTRASSIAGEVDLELRLLPILGDTVALNLQLDLLDAQADLMEIRCPGRDRQQPEVVLGVDSGIASVRINNDGINGPPLINLLGLVQVCASSTPVSGQSPAYLSRSFVGPFSPDDTDLLQQNTQVVGAGVGSQVSHLLSDVIDGTTVEFCPGSPTGPALNLLLAPALAVLGVGGSNGLLDLVENALSSALGGIVDPILQPLLSTLGIDLLGTTVTVMDVYVPPPALIETQ